MNYRVTMLWSAQKALAALPDPMYGRVRDALRALSANPRPSGARKLRDRDGWRIRIGDFRVIYDVNDAMRVVTVLDIDHRRDVYRH